MNRPLPILLIATLVLLLQFADRSTPVAHGAAACDRLRELPREVELAFYRAGESAALDRWNAQAIRWQKEIAALERPELAFRTAALRTLIAACTRRLNRTSCAEDSFGIDEAMARVRALR